MIMIFALPFMPALVIVFIGDKWENTVILYPFLINIEIYNIFNLLNRGLSFVSKCTVHTSV